MDWGGSVPAPTLTGFARIALAGALVLAAVAVVVGASTAAGVALSLTAAAAVAVSSLFTSSELKHARAAVESQFPGRLDSYQIARWSLLWTRNERRLRCAMADPEILSVENLASQLGKAADAMRTDLVAWALLFVLIAVAVFR